MINSKTRYVLLRDHSIRLLNEAVVLELTGTVDDSMWLKLVNDVDIAETLAGDLAKNLIINLSTYGGDLYYGLAIYDYLCGLKADGTHITLICQGPVMSAGTIILCAGDRTYTYPNAQFMIHYGSQESAGPENFTDAEVNQKHWKRLTSRMVTILKTKLNVTSRTLNTWLKNDKYLNAEEAIKYGLVKNEIGTL